MTIWYVTRATGVVALMLLTLTVALGLANSARMRSQRIPRFVVSGVHRNASMLAVCFVAAHVVTVIADGYVSIPIASALVPFTSGYRPFWIGLGAVALDLLLAVFLTSLLRRRIGNRGWRATHWLAYGSWPIAVIHGVGTGTDAGSSWMLAITGACITLVLVALAVRLRARSAPPVRLPARRRTATPRVQVET